MIKNRLLIFLFFGVFNFCFCQVKNNEKIKSNNASLVIEGNRIWVREKPKTGKVIFTLNAGDVCRILKKGEEQIIRGNKDFWYEIIYNEKIGWVFGSQTSMKQHTRLESFLDDFLTASFFGKKFDSLVYYNSEIIKNVTRKNVKLRRVYNPGAACIFSNSYKGDIKHGITYPKIQKENQYFNQDISGGFCEESTNKNGVYYKVIEKLPKFFNMEADEYVSINIPEEYRDELKVKVDVLVDKWIIKTMYFIIADNEWQLVLIDDCDCSA